MAKSMFTCKEVSLTYAQMLQLRNAGVLNLGINNDLAAQIANARGGAPTKSTASVAFHFWNWVAVGVFGYSIYTSFTKAWWWFIPGFIGMSIIWSANKKGNSENLLDAGLRDGEFYERVRNIGGWIYQIESSEAEQFKTQSP
jgi:hypothetical protein